MCVVALFSALLAANAVEPVEAPRPRSVIRPALGIIFRPPLVEVREVVRGGPAEAAGVRAGDVISRVGDSPVGDAEELRAAVRRLAPGRPVALVVVRDGERRTLSVTPGAINLRPSRIP